MTAAALSRPESLPCHSDPERWFDRRHQAAALAGCRRCPVRRWCAREALRCRASWGLWAGVWIDGQHEDAMQHLRAVADGTLAQSAAVAAVFAERRLRANRTDHRHSPAAEPRRPRQSSGAASAATAVLARSSGHCEVLAEGCRYTFDRLVSRLPTATRNETLTAPTAFAACGSCADSLAGLSPDLAAELGYLVDGCRSPAQVPFYWRSSRWVLFTRDGWFTDMAERSDQIAV